MTYLGLERLQKQRTLIITIISTKARIPPADPIMIFSRVDNGNVGAGVGSHALSPREKGECA